MKRFLTIALVALVALAALAIPVSAEESVMIRSTIINDTDLETYLDTNGDIVFNAYNFAGFWADLDDDLASETLTILNASTVSDNDIAEDGLVYNATIVQTDYEGAFAAEADVSGSTNMTYPLLGLFAEVFVPVSDSDAGELVKLLMDSDDKYTLRTGSALELPNGYALTAKQIDVEGDKVWMELTKDGEFVEDEVIDVTAGEATWDYDVDVGDEDDVIVFRVQITDVFQGQVDSLAVVEGLWLIDYEDVMEIETSDEFGELEVDSVGSTIVMKNSGTLSLSRDKTVDIAEDMIFVTADDSDCRFFVAKTYTAPGTYTIRGTIETTGAASWNAYSFAAFWADLDDDLGSETLAITTNLGNSSRDIAEDELYYNATIVQTDYEGDFAAEADVTGAANMTFPLIGLFAEPYVPVSDTDAGELVKLLMDSDDKYTLRTGSALELPNGYALTAKQIDVEGDKVWMELSKDGEFVEDEVVDTTAGEATWDYDVDVGDEDDVVVFRVQITDVFQGQVDSLAVVEGLWLIDYENVMEIETSDEFGELEVSSVGSTIVMQNSGTITLGQDDTVDIAEGMKFMVADDSALRYFPYVERTIGESDAVEVVDDEDAEDVEMPTEEEVADEEVADEEVADEEVADEEVADEEADEEEEEPVEESPGFESIFAVAGLLAVAYLVRRN